MVNKEDALRLLAHDQFKAKLIEQHVDDDMHVAFYVFQDRLYLSKHSNWELSSDNYGLKLLPQVEVNGEVRNLAVLFSLGRKRDHRVIGRKQGLFYQNKLSPGSWLFSKEGAIIYNGLISMMREQYKYRGYDEVISPNLYDSKIFKISGHYQNYKDNMFMIKHGDSGMCLKPMNCPGHYLLFKSKIRSYRELPLRFAEFGVLHRNELSGALSGLSRCRRFQVDDCHILCAESQIHSEIMNNLNFVKDIYSMFGFEYKFYLSSKPEKYLGSDDLWEKAEYQLKQALDEFGMPWEENPGDGAFYGPKIDIMLFDSMGRPHQCASIQVDFQAPIRFNLMYKSDEDPIKLKDEVQADAEPKKGDFVDFPPDEYDSQPFRWEEKPLKPGYKRPVVLHRAVLGSLERFISILIEHNEGKWPFWLSPRQAIVIPISDKFSEYCERVYDALRFNGFHAAIDSSNANLNKKIKNAQLDQWNYMLVVGQKEIDAEAVNVRSRDGSRVGQIKVDDLIEKFEKERQLIPKFRFSQQF